MNYINVIELLNNLDRKVLDSKLITYTKNFMDNRIN